MGNGCLSGNISQESTAYRRSTFSMFAASHGEHINIALSNIHIQLFAKRSDNISIPWAFDKQYHIAKKDIAIANVNVLKHCLKCFRIASVNLRSPFLMQNLV